MAIYLDMNSIPKEVFNKVDLLNNRNLTKNIGNLRRFFHGRSPSVQAPQFNEVLITEEKSNINKLTSTSIKQKRITSPSIFKPSTRKGSKLPPIENQQDKQDSTPRINKRMTLIFHKRDSVNGSANVKSIERVYNNVFDKNLKPILQIKKHGGELDKKVDMDENEKKSFISKSYVNSQIVDMKKKVYFMKGVMDYIFPKIMIREIKKIKNKSIDITNLQKDKTKARHVRCYSNVN